jgi:chromate transporter
LSLSPKQTQPTIPSANAAPAAGAKLREIAGYFLLLGFTAFGGPAAHLAMMEKELVHKRRWIDRQHFLDLLAAINFIPGPNSTEMVLALGKLRGGLRGMVVAGACFILPAVLIILPIAWMYVLYHQSPKIGGTLRGINAAVVAIVALAALRLGKSAITDAFTLAVAALAAIGQTITHQYRWAAGDVALLAIAAIAGWMRAAPWRGNPSTGPSPLAILPLALKTTLFSGPLLLALLFLKIGATLFGGGYLLVTYLQTSFVDHQHWLTTQQMLDAVAVGQFTPGPLLTTATFVGFVVAHDHFAAGPGLEIACALLATAAIFAPAFILVATLSSAIESIRKMPAARAMLGSMNAAVVGLIASTCGSMAIQTLILPGAARSAGIIAAAFALMLLLEINSVWIILASAAAGWLLLT